MCIRRAPLAEDAGPAIQLPDSELSISCLCFASDVALVAESARKAGRGTELFFQAVRELGLKRNLDETKALRCRRCWTETHIDLDNCSPHTCSRWRRR